MRFGGPWTIEKLDILEAYLDRYTTALKGQAFDLIYIDAFAGTGQVELHVEDRDYRLPPRFHPAGDRHP